MSQRKYVPVDTIGRGPPTADKQRGYRSGTKEVYERLR